jgi:hypothetical protein
MFFLYGTKGSGDQKERFFLGSGESFEEAKQACRDAVDVNGHDRAYLKTFGAHVVYVHQSMTDPDPYAPCDCIEVDPHRVPS